MSAPPIPQPKVTRYLRRKQPDHPLADSTGCVRIHRAVLWDKIGPGEHVCHWCRRRLHWDAKGIERLAADHLDGDTWNNDPANLVPACRTCNSGRSRRPDFLTHCEKGHRWTSETEYHRPDTNARSCRICNAERDRSRDRRKR